MSKRDPRGSLCYFRGIVYLVINTTTDTESSVQKQKEEQPTDATTQNVKRPLERAVQAYSLYDPPQKYPRRQDRHAGGYPPLTCLFPVTAYWSRELTRNGKRKLVSKKQDAHSPAPIRRPCGNCIPCRIDEARQWSTRCTHEHMMHKQHAIGSFLTVTYNDEHLPAGNSLDRESLVLFMKRLRKKFSKHDERSVRFFACGEYGDTTLRPHYHVLLLSHDIPQRRLYKRTAAGHDLYRSEWLDDVWSYGNIDIGTVTSQTIRYATQYVLKKVTGEPATEYYGGREPEFITMSRNPGLGHAFYMKYAHQLYAHDYCIIDGKETPLPEYYDRMYSMLDSVGLAQLKKTRRRKSLLQNSADKTHARRRIRELVILKRQANFKRNAQ